VEQVWIGGQRLAPQDDGDFGSAVRRAMGEGA